MPVLKVSVLDSVFSELSVLFIVSVYLHLILVATCRRRNVTFLSRSILNISPSERGFREKAKKKGEREAEDYCGTF